MGNNHLILADSSPLYHHSHSIILQHMTCHDYSHPRSVLRLSSTFATATNYPHGAMAHGHIEEHRAQTAAAKLQKALNLRVDLMLAACECECPQIMYIHIYMYICISICIYIYINIYIYVLIYIYSYLYIFIIIHICMYIYILYPTYPFSF